MNHSKDIKLSEELINDHIFKMITLGYSVIENFITEDECTYLRTKLEKTIEEYQPVQKSERSVLDKYHMHDLLCRDFSFAKTLENPRLQQLISPLLGEHWIMYAYTSSSLPPNGKNYGSRIHTDSPRFIQNYPTNIGIIWALDDFTKENGGTLVLPGSHNTDLVPSDNYFKSNCITLTCNKGALIVFNARLFHAAGVNMTEQFRHALTLNACRPFMKQRMDWVRFIPKSITDQLNTQAKRIIGFDTRVPTNLNEFFLPENERLYKPNQE
jgi:ectoine hydroxylase-related dioxygenase (phytanoyl-CoA dioxygenase family)